MSLISYIKDTRAEFVHVNWPTRRQSIILTVAVILVSIVVAAFLGLFDFLFSRVLETFIS